MKIIFSILLFTITSFSQETVVVYKNHIDSLIVKFNDADPFVCGYAVNELGKIGEPAAGSLIECLKNENENVRWCAAITLEKIAPQGKSAVPMLVKTLRDQSSNIRWAAAIALGKYGNEALLAIPELQNMLYNENTDERWAAYISLTRIDKNSLNIIPELSDVKSKIESMTPELMYQLEVPGVSITLIQNNQIVWSRQFGVTDADSETKVTPNTMFEACSMSKPVFAYIVLKLIESGKLDLDTPLSQHLPESFVSGDDGYANEITARMVLSHTTGMPNWRKGGEEVNAPLPVYFKPGTKFSYSGEGIYYLQRVIEHITKESLESLSKRILFDKLGLKSTSFIWTAGFNKQISTGHDSDGDCLTRSKYLHPNAAYTLYTTSDDYARFIIEIMKPSVQDVDLSISLRSEMLRHQVISDTREVTDRPGRHLGLYSFRGLGWGIDSTITGNIIYHSGSNQTGFRCYSQFDVKTGSGIVIMTNGVNGSELWVKLIAKIGDL